MSPNRSPNVRETAAVALLYGLADAALLQWTAYVITPAALATAAITAALVMGLAHAALAFALARFPRAVWTGPALTVVVYGLLRLRAFRAPTLLLICALLVVAVAAAGLSYRARAGGAAGARPTLSLVMLAVAPWVAAAGPGAGGNPVGTHAVIPLIAVVLLFAAGLGLARSAAGGRGRAGLLLATSMVVTYPWLPGAPDCGVAAAADVTQGAVGAPAQRTTDLVIVVVMDTVSAERTSLYAADIPTTPALVELASTATVHTSAWSEASWSLPSHASLLTGYLPHDHGAHRVLVRSAEGPGRWTVTVRPLDARIPTLPERLASAGVRSAVAAANYGYFSAEYGLTRGFDRVHSCPRNLLRIEALAAPLWRRVPALDGVVGGAFRTRYTADQMFERALDWIDESEATPQFVLINLMDAHPPTFAAPLARRFPQVGRIDGRSAALRDYDLAIRSIDESLGRFVQELRSRGRFDDTMLVVTSDHGETFRAGGSAHASTLRASETHVPLLVKEPGQRQPRRLHAPVQLSDVARWVADALGVPDAAAESTLPADVAVMENFLSLPAGSGPLEVSLEETPGTRPSHWSLVRDGWQLIVGDDGGRELYDVSVPGGVAPDLAAEMPDRVEAMSALLRELLPASAFEVDLVESLAEPDPEVLERLRSLGYIQ